jgi:hypothetical protein
MIFPNQNSLVMLYMSLFIPNVSYKEGSLTKKGEVMLHGINLTSMCFLFQL